MIIAFVIFELIGCVFLALLIGAGNGGGAVAIAPLAVWFVCASLQLAIQYLPRSGYVRYYLLLAVGLMLLATVSLEGLEVFPYGHQALFIAGVGVLPQLLLDRFAKISNAPLIGLIALPLGYCVWSFANIGIVKLRAESVTKGEPYCLLVSEGRISSPGYRKAPDDWSLSGWRMFSARGVGGSGDCCQWDFHAVLVTQGNQIFNWSYRTQRFEQVSERSRGMLGLWKLPCS